VASALYNELQTIGAATNAANAKIAASANGLIGGWFGEATLVFGMGGDWPLAGAAGMSMLATQTYNSFAQVPAVATAIYNATNQYNADVAAFSV
jgi:hypothetical protein